MQADCYPSAPSCPAGPQAGDLGWPVRLSALGLAILKRPGGAHLREDLSGLLTSPHAHHCICLRQLIAAIATY